MRTLISREGFGRQAMQLFTHLDIHKLIHKLFPMRPSPDDLKRRALEEVLERNAREFARWEAQEKLWRGTDAKNQQWFH